MKLNKDDFIITSFRNYSNGKVTFGLSLNLDVSEGEANAIRDDIIEALNK